MEYPSTGNNPDSLPSNAFEIDRRVSVSWKDIDGVDGCCFRWEMRGRGKRY